MAEEKPTLEQLLILARKIPKENWEYYYLPSDAAEKLSCDPGAREVFREKNRLDKIGNFYDYTDWDYRGFIGRCNQGTIKIIQSLRNINTLYGGDRYLDDEIKAKGSSGGDEFLLSADLKRKYYHTKRFVSPKTCDSKLYWTHLTGNNYLNLKRKLEKEYKQVQRLFQIPYQILLEKSPLGEEKSEEVISIPIPIGGIDDY
jgi:hypothetical protein